MRSQEKIEKDWPDLFAIVCFSAVSSLEVLADTKNYAEFLELSPRSAARYKCLAWMS